MKSKALKARLAEMGARLEGQARLIADQNRRQAEIIDGMAAQLGRNLILVVPEGTVTMPEVFEAKWPEVNLHERFAALTKTVAGMDRGIAELRMELSK